MITEHQKRMTTNLAVLFLILAVVCVGFLYGDLIIKNQKVLDAKAEHLRQGQWYLYDVLQQLPPAELDYDKDTLEVKEFCYNGKCYKPSN